MEINENKQASPAWKKFFINIIPAFPIALGLLATYSGYEENNKIEQTKLWPIAQGVIQQSSLEHSRKTYHANVTYNFTVNGESFSGNRVSYGNLSSSNPAHAQETINKYKVGSEVSVHYNSENPKISTLETESIGGVGFRYKFGIFLIALGFIMIILFRKVPKHLESVEKEYQKKSQESANQPRI